MDKENVYIIIPVHNRKAITLQCLETLKNNGDLDCYHVVVVDDGSSDGTAQDICFQYRSVTILYGNGNLWWGGAIYKGMEYAYTQGAEYFIWLNDDCYCALGTIHELIKICEDSKNTTIVSAQCHDPDTQIASYGGLIIGTYRLKSIYASPGGILSCDALNGNLVCIPRIVVETLGLPDAHHFPHHLLDYIYTYAAKKAGFNILLSNQFYVSCRNDSPYKSWILSQKSLFPLWQSYFDPTSVNHWKHLVLAYSELLGSFGVYYFFIHSVIKFWLIFTIVLLLPYTLRIKLKSFLSKLKQT